MEGRTVKSLALPDLALQPGEAREMAIGDLMRKRPQIADFNLSFSWDGDWGDILAGVGSIDQTGSYVFPIPPEAVYKGGARGSVYWLAGGGFDTMYSLWNPEQDAHDFLVTLKYGANGEAYRLPVTLEGHASTMIDIGELIRTQQLDQDGKLLPPDAKQGSLVVSGPADDLEDAIDVVLTGGIYNPTKATCGSSCNFCAGWTTITFGPTTFSLQAGSQQSLTLGYVDNYGSHYDMTRWADWETSNSSIVGLNSDPGWAQGMGAGTATVTAGYEPVPIYHGYCCGYPGPPQCPMTQIGGTATGTVAPKLDPISPSHVGVGNPEVFLTLTGRGFGGSPTVNISGIGTYTGTGFDTSTSITIDTTVSGATLGDHQVSVTVNGQTSTNQTLTLVCAVPTNFQMVQEQCLPGGNLQFIYSFESSTGNQSDIAACYVGELVTYNGATPRSPPFPQNSGYPDPTINPPTYQTIGEGNGLRDTQWAPAGEFLHPYSNTPVFLGVQSYRFDCPCQGQPVIYTPFPGYAGIGISRQVSNGSGAWAYYVSKQGYSCSLTLP